MKRLALIRLLQLGSQALPIGGFSHSHGLEAAVEARVVIDEASLRRWLMDVCDYCMQGFEIPYLNNMADAWVAGDTALAAALNDEFLAARESAELRAASAQMGYSLRSLLCALPDLPVPMLDGLRAVREPSLPCAWSAAASAWQIEPAESVMGYLWSWAENQVLAALKSVPLGQSAGQRVLLGLGGHIARLSDSVAAMPGAAREPLSNFAPGLAILSSHHEAQYSRLFRS